MISTPLAEPNRLGEGDAPKTAPRQPYDKPEVLSESTPLLALLTSQCDGVDTPNAG